MDFVDYVKKEYNHQAVWKQKYQKILDVLSKDEARLVMNRGEYYIIDKTGRHYANRSMKKRVERLKLKKLLEKAVKRLDGNVKALRRVLKEYEPYDYDSLNGLVSAAYKGAFLPGQLIFTMDGPDGGLDAGPVIDFLKAMILPRIQMAEAAAKKSAAC